jgi:hypothetical protein
MFMGRQWGCAPDFLNYRLGGFEQTYRDSLAITLLHDAMVRAGQSTANIGLASSLWRLMDQFGRKEARFLPYWEDQDFVTAQPEGVYVSLYRHPKNGVLAVISNLGKEKVTAEAHFDLPKLGGSGQALTAEDALAKQPVEVSEGAVRLELPSQGWKLLWLRPKG